MNRRQFLATGVYGAYAANTLTSHAASDDLDTIEIGLIGNDGHFGYVFSGIPKVKGARLAAYAKSRPDEDVAWLRRSQVFTEQTQIFDDYEEMLEKMPLDVVVVCLPYYRNAAASIAAARKGIHIISEKPVATTDKDLNALDRTVKENGVRLTAMFGMRYIPAYLCIHKAIAEGAVGEPILASAQKSYKWGRSRPDFFRKRETYGGSFLWVGIHAVDYIHFTTGLNYTQVMGLHGNKVHPDYPGCEDYGAMILQFDNRGTADIHIDYLRPPNAPTHGDDRLRIVGSKGVIELKDFGKRVELIAGDDEPRDLDLPEAGNLFVDFAAELRGEGKHLIGPEDAVQMTRVCIKARDAADQGRIIDL